jgi:serine/threonine protein kinase
VSELDPEGLIGGRYRIQRRLGEGGLGSVYLAVDEQTGRPTVVKRAKTQRLAPILEREARLLSRIKNRHVAGYVDFLMHDERAYLVQEFVEGAVLLDAWQAGQRLPGVCRLYAAVAETLASLHEAGFVHRDLKPSNVLVRQDEPVLVDFGLAIRRDERDLLTESSATVVGTPAYMAPEAIRSEGELGPGADVFSLGVMLFEAVTGSLPEGKVRSVAELLTVRTTRGSIGSGVQRIASNPALSELGTLLADMLGGRPETRPSAARVAARLSAMADDPQLREVGLPSIRSGPPAGTAAVPSALPTQANRSSGTPKGRNGARGQRPARRREHPVRKSRRGNSAGSAGRRRLLVLGVGLAVSLAVALAVGLTALDVGLAQILPVLPWISLMVGGIVLGVLLVKQVHASRESPAPLGELSREAVRRIAAIEAHVERSQQFTESLAIQLEELVEESVHTAVRESLLLALKELKPSDAGAPSDMARLIDVVEKLAVTGSSAPESKSWTDKVQSYLGIPVAMVAAGGGVLGFASSLGLWRANHPPEIVSFKADRAAVRPGASVSLSLEVRDPEGDELVFAYSAVEGRVDGAGPSLVFTAPKKPAHPVVMITATVSDRHSDAVQRILGIPVRPAPTGHIVFHEPPKAGSRIQVSAEVQYDEMEALTFTWLAEPGRIEPNGSRHAFWSIPDAASTTAHVVCIVKDVLGEVPLSENTVVLEAAPAPQRPRRR